MLDVAFVGTGADPDDPGQDGFAMAYRHANGYERLDDCRLAACADVVPANARAFAETYDVPDDRVYEDYERMLHEAEPDVVSVCVPPAVHAEIVRGAARTGVPAAIHCEKPMATTWRDALGMARACKEAGVKLSINHQRRVGPIYREAKSLVDDGTVGALRRVEWSAKNLFDSGTHQFDLANFFADDADVEWVLAALDYSEENRWFGAHNENQAIAQWRYETGVYGQATTGRTADALGPRVRLVGTDGTIEVGADDGPPLRVRTGDGSWSAIDAGENLWGDARYDLPRNALYALGERLPVPGLPTRPDYPSHVDRAIASVVGSVRDGGQSPLRAERALDATELIFAAWESVRRRGRVELPLEIRDNPLEAMVEDGVLDVEAETDAATADD